MAIELAIGAPLLIFFLLVVVALGRVSHARQQVAGAAADAARAAALARLPGQPGEAARAAAARSLAGGGVSCADVSVAVDAADERPGGSVRATVRCVTSLSGLGLTGLPGARTLTASAAAPLDAYRSSGS